MRSVVTTVLIVAAVLWGLPRLNPDTQTCSAVAQTSSQPQGDCSTGPKIRFRLSWSEAPEGLVVEYYADGHGLGPTHPDTAYDEWDVTLPGTVGFISLSAPRGSYIGFLKCRLSNPDTNEQYDAAEYFPVDGPLQQLPSGKWGIECHTPGIA
ncbi:MAG TPA: hypothetical protein VMT30_08410 [Candidatus Saccharimonadia bacterium]|nr:hypothetical protein [Candidatus Saccharimonadia bacterium]